MEEETRDFLYVLKLVGEKYYVGRTNNLQQSLKEDWGETSPDRRCEWLKQNKPIRVVRVVENPNAFSDDHWVKKYMNKYGIGNVRGGTYLKPELYTIEEQVLKREFSK